MIALAEILPHPIARKQEHYVSAYREMLLNSTYIAAMDVTAEVAVRAAHLRAQYNLKTPDALHLATAIEAGCQAFLTNDADLKRVPGIRVLVLDALELDASDGVQEGAE